jgi:hypothetical protein
MKWLTSKKFLTKYLPSVVLSSELRQLHMSIKTNSSASSALSASQGILQRKQHDIQGTLGYIYQLLNVSVQNLPAVHTRPIIAF